MTGMRGLALFFFLAMALGAIIIAAVLLASVVLAVDAWADPVQPAPSQPDCQPRAQTIAKAKARWKEEPIFLGAAGSGAMLLITRSEKKGWTAFMCNPAVCCMVSAGTHSEFLKGA